MCREQPCFASRRAGVRLRSPAIGQRRRLQRADHRGPAGPPCRRAPDLASVLLPTEQVALAGVRGPSPGQKHLRRRASHLHFGRFRHDGIVRRTLPVGVWGSRRVTATPGGGRNPQACTPDSLPQFGIIAARAHPPPIVTRGEGWTAFPIVPLRNRLVFGDTEYVRPCICGRKPWPNGPVPRRSHVVRRGRYGHALVTALGTGSALRSEQYDGDEARRGESSEHRAGPFKCVEIPRGRPRPRRRPSTFDWLSQDRYIGR